MTSLQTSSLHRKMSNRSQRSDWTHNDGHVEGNLNCIALRHGWTRTFSLPPDEVSGLDYALLETVLQLPTLKLRTMTTRIFVENPPSSGNWSKIRFWKDDGSLQSVLVQQFFAARMRDGVVTSFDVRDGHDRDDVMSIKSGMSGRSGVSRIVPGTGQTREWLKRRGLGARSPGLTTDGEEDASEIERAPKPPPKGGRIQALKYIFGISSQPPAPPVRTAEEIEQELINEEEAMKKRGWLPPGVRRLGAKAKASSSSIRVGLGNNMFGNSSERDFFRRRRRQRQQGSDDNENQEDPFAGDGEEINMSDADDRNPDINVINEGEEDAREVQPAEGSKKWFGLFGGGGGSSSNLKTPDAEGGEASQSSTSLATLSKGDNPFLGASEKKSKKKKDKGKQKAFTGAELVKVPSDAFEKPEDGGTPKPSSAVSSLHKD